MFWRVGCGKCIVECSSNGAFSGITVSLLEGQLGDIQFLALEEMEIAVCPELLNQSLKQEDC